MKKDKKLINNKDQKKPDSSLCHAEGVDSKVYGGIFVGGDGKAPDGMHYDKATDTFKYDILNRQ